MGFSQPKCGKDASFFINIIRQRCRHKRNRTTAASPRPTSPRHVFEQLHLCPSAILIYEPTTNASSPRNYCDAKLKPPLGACI